MSASPAVKAPDPNRVKKQAFVRIVEQPASKGLRFRYECEGRSAGSIPGVNSTNDNKTFPTIQIVGYQGRAVVVVSCVTSEPPYRPHPHSLVGKEGCKKGVCTMEIPPETMTLAFPSLGIQCVKKKEIEEALCLRQQIRVDPFQTGFAHKENPQSIDLNCVRLAFQVFLEGNDKGAFTFALKPVVTDPIYDKKSRNDLTICRMTEYTASVAGGKEMLIFCDKVSKDDIQIRFYEERDGKLAWEGFGDFQPSDVHKQYGICFRTPRYHNLEIEDPIKVHLQLRRPSDGASSEPRDFEFLPLDAGRGLWTAKRLKTNYSVFNNILSTENHIRTGIKQEEVRRKVRGPTGDTQVIHERQAPPPPARNPVLNSMLPAATSARPLSEYSLMSDITVTDTASTATGRQSVNDILSLAAGEDMSVYSFGGLESTTASVIDLQAAMKNPVLDIMGSLTSVATVRENCAPEVKTEDEIKVETLNDVDISAIYDDVMQCVYDDVDTKYDDVDFAEPPVPPVRQRKMSEHSVATTTSVDKPLPVTPSKLPAFIAKINEKKVEIKQEREEKQQKKREMEEQKKKEKEEKKERKRKEEEERKAKRQAQIEAEEKQKQSLFQRLFNRSKSQNENDLDAEGNIVTEGPPPVPVHLSLDVPEDANKNLSAELDQFMDSEGNLENLDTMVEEFANQFLPTSTSDGNASAQQVAQPSTLNELNS